MGEEDRIKQVGFRCSESFFNRMEAHRKRRQITMQEMIIQALERDFEQADMLNSRNTRAVRNVTKFWQTPEQEAFVRAVFKASESMPREKLELLKTEIEMDADAYRKAATRGPRPSRYTQGRYDTK